MYEPSPIKTYLVYDTATGLIACKLTCMESMLEANIGEGKSFVEVDQETDCQNKKIVAGQLVDDQTQLSQNLIAEQRLLRYSMLNQSTWTIQEDSPLTEECKQAFKAWRISLHRHLVDYPDGLTPLPEEPALVYTPLENQV